MRARSPERTQFLFVHPKSPFILCKNPLSAHPQGFGKVIVSVEHPQVEFSLKHSPKNPLGGINKQIGKGCTETGKGRASNSQKNVGNGTEGTSDAAGSEDEDGQAQIQKVWGVKDGWKSPEPSLRSRLTKDGICWCPHEL